MKRGFSIPAVLIFVALFISIPVVYWVFINSTANDNVRGASSKNATPTPAGVSIRVSSTNGTWDLFQYLCSTKEECMSSLAAGKRVQVISGGPASAHDVFVPTTSDWQTYKYSKVYVRSGWGTQYRTFNVLSSGDVPNTEIFTIKNDNNDYKVILFPLNDTVNSFYRSAEFSDK